MTRITNKTSKISYNTIEGMEEIFKKNHEDRTNREKDFILRFLMKCVDFFKECQKEILNSLIEKFEPVEFEPG